MALISKKAGHFRPNVCRDLTRAFSHPNIPLRFYYIEDEKELAGEIDAAFRAGCRDYLAVGGDGTVSLVASCLYGKPHRLGVIPAGTANTMARVLGVPMSAKKAIRLAVSSGKTKFVDGMDVRGRIYLLNVSAGLSSISLDRLNEKTKSTMGMFSYVIGVARASLKVAPCSFNITIDGRRICSRDVELHVTNLGVLGLPRYHIHEHSLLDDGKVEVLGLSDLAPTTVIGAVLEVILRRRKRRSIRLLGEGSEVVIDSDVKQSVQGDGDIIGPTPVSLKVRSRAINFIVP
ncbi:diacylglycerol/lipid kinase family protein [Dehalogenimonas formicexedens]|uniref:diacylglycerol/lipid kinase family protein n=1 Tax=Dehalogenimonas formicexedens TaxID=1839801 RepID=UPI0013147DB7|nr:diacylglycerol kinase family protein [Dehalogenimonas formicexedens]